jgi:YjbE family integral membrane protein
MLLTGLLAFAGVILIDIVLSGDNAVVIGAMAASLPEAQRNKAIMYGMIIAVVARIILSLGAVYLLMIPGIQVIGAAALIWVAYNMYKDLKDDGDLNDSTETKAPRTFASAMIAITVADLSMSIDNVLAVAGTARDHWEALVFGLVLSVAIMAFAAKFVSNMIQRWAWIAWVGLAFILIIAAKMFYHGIPELLAYFN